MKEINEENENLMHICHMMKTIPYIDMALVSFTHLKLILPFLSTLIQEAGFLDIKKLIQNAIIVV